VLAGTTLSGEVFTQEGFDVRGDRRHDWAPPHMNDSLKLAMSAPVVDGYVLPDEPMRIFAQGMQNDVPLIAGWNAHESGPFRGRARPNKDAAAFIAAAQEKYRAASMSAFASLYPAATDAEATASAFRLSGEEAIAFPTWWWVGLQARTGRAPVHAYHFTMSSPYNPTPDHTSEIAYVFGNFPAKGGIAAGPDDIAFSQIVRHYWTNFAKTGDPVG
jgi:para-nitrobenzyl esterase